MFDALESGKYITEAKSGVLPPIVGAIASSSRVPAHRLPPGGGAALKRRQIRDEPQIVDTSVLGDITDDEEAEIGMPAKRRGVEDARRIRRRSKRRNSFSSYESASAFDSEESAASYSDEDDVASVKRPSKPANVRNAGKVHANVANQPVAAVVVVKKDIVVAAPTSAQRPVPVQTLPPKKLHNVQEALLALSTQSSYSSTGVRVSDTSIKRASERPRSVSYFSLSVSLSFYRYLSTSFWSFSLFYPIRVFQIAYKFTLYLYIINRFL